MTEVILIGTPETETSRKADAIVEDCIVLLAKYDSETLEAVADYAAERCPDGWLAKMIHEYLEVWR